MTRACLIALLAASAIVEARPRYDVHLAIDPSARTATGEVEIDFVNSTDAPLGELALWLFPESLQRPSQVLDEHNFYWVYPRRFDAGRMTVTELAVDGSLVRSRSDRARLDVVLGQPLAPGARAHVTARVAIRIPLRYGGFGCYRQGCTLAGGFSPQLAALGPHGFDRALPPEIAEWNLRLDAPSGYDVLLAGEPQRAVHLEAAIDPVLRVDARPTVTRTLSHRGVDIELHHHDLRPPPPEPPGHAMPYLVEDRARLVMDAARDALDFLHDEGFDVPAGTRLPLIEIPLRMELASARSGAVLISDQLFRITPVDRLRKFHTLQLVRALFDFLLEERLITVASARDVAWSPDAIGSWLLDRYTLRAYRRAEFAQQLLRWVAFIPQVDRILYAPQIQFASAYFNTLDEPDPTREDVRHFNHRQPRGKTIHEKLRDLAGDAGEERIMRAALAGEPLRAAAERELRRPLDDFFAQWLGDYPHVDYRLSVAERTPRGIVVTIWKAGPPPRPVEPVEVLVVEEGGARHELRWDGQGDSHAFDVAITRDVELVELDPRGRLLERGESNDDPRLDNRSPQNVKLIYNNFGALIDFTTLSLDLSLDFTLQRIHDVKNSARFVLYRAPGVEAGLSASYTRSFGPLVTPAALAAGAGLTLRVVRLDSTFGRAGEPEIPGTQLLAGLGVGYDDRIFAWEPWRSTSLNASLSYALTIRDNGATLSQVTTSVHLGRILPIDVGHGIALEIDAAITGGDLRVPTQMFSAGSPSWLRAYAPDELLGRARLFTRAEYRHVFVHDLNLNFLQLVFLRGIAGAFFTEAAIISPCERYSASLDDLFGDVGYSLRFQADWLGVSQTLLNIDVAVPLVRRARGCFQETGQAPPDPATRAPLGVFLYFGPVW